MVKRRNKKRNVFVTVLMIIGYIIIILILMKITGVEGIFNREETSTVDGAGIEMNGTELSVSPTPLKQEDVEELEEDQIPESLIELAESNPEAIDFVRDYPKLGKKEKKINIKRDVRESEGIPLFLQWDKRWGYREYGGDFLAVTGCGPTCLSMVRCGLGKDTKWNPYEVAKMSDENGFYVEGQGSSWELMTSGAAMIGLSSSEVVFDKDHISSLLLEGTPIICAMRPGDFTTTGHFIVLIAMDEDGSVWIHDPNSISRSNRSWTLDELMPQIRNLWSFTLV